MKRFSLFFALVLVAALTLSTTDNAQAQRSPLVLAFYYNWYDENTWRADKVPDMPAEKYVSRDANAMARHIRQARGAGIDAFIVSWWGAGNPTDDNFKTMLDLARGMDFKVGVDFELTSPFYHSKDDVVRSLKHLLGSYTQHPAYARSDGKPIIFFWREQKYSVDEWQAIRNEVDPDHRTLWIAEGLDVSYLRVFDGHHLYMVAWAPNPQAELNKWPPRIAKYGADKIWVATVNPGADNRKTTQPEKVVRDREGGEYYRETWRAAFSTMPDWIMVTSWNEWMEGTMIEPSVTYGNLYLDITREFAARFKGGLPTPTPTRTATPKPTATSTRTPPPPATATRPIPPGGIAAITIDTAPVRSEADADSEIQGYLREGSLVKLLARSADSDWWQITYPSGGQRAWISATLVRLDIDSQSSAGGVANPTRTAAPTLEPTATLQPTATIEPTIEPTATPAFTATPKPPEGFVFPSLKNILPFLP